MRVVLAAPNFPQPRGNTVTVKRIAGSLKESGIDTEIISITEEDGASLIEGADLVHGFHAYRFYEFLERTGMEIDSYIISITGTDLNHDFYDETKRKHILNILENAKAIHVFTNEAKETLSKEYPPIKEKTMVIPQGTNAFPNIKTRVEKEDKTFVFLMPAGIRKVKNIPGAIEMLSSLHKQFPHIRLWIAGPILEEEEGKKVMRLVENNKDWITYFGEVSFAEMGSLYNQADALVNSSLSEGQASAILEAMDHSLPVLVSANQGNKSIVDNGKTGFVYENRNQFLDYAGQIVNNNKLRQQIGQQAKEYIAEYHSGQKEAIAFRRLYQHIYAGLKMEGLRPEDLGLSIEK